MLAIALILNRLRDIYKAFAGKRLTVPWAHRRLQVGLLASASFVLSTYFTGCREQGMINPRKIAIQQSWELAPGDSIEGFLVAASLGDISIHMRGASVRAPFPGEVEPAASGNHCIFFSSPEIPAYLFRYCGLKSPRLGEVRIGQSIGKANFLHFATLRRQPEGTWAIVEPSTHVLERSLERY